ncbi:Beta-mannosidase like protein [Argiope bruennichi]|uniref:beta-mannosidase n=1 Tax=Argiope bruennichi TaxID=94029 RepID=A0A8T0ELP0_ARGBR|nr:Beta-mannosidase like protein [Argiope bruennichi]
MYWKNCAFLILCGFCFTFARCSFPNGSFIIYRSPSVLSLNGIWTAVNSNGSIIVKAKVPGSIYTDLQRNNIIQEPYFGENDLLYRWVGQDNWIFKRKFIGTWKPLEVVGFDTLLITDVTVVPDIINGKLQNMTITTHMETASFDLVNGNMTISLNDSVIFQSNISIKPDENLSAQKTIKIIFTKNYDIKLWWPNGLGSRPLYTLKIIFSNNEESVSKSIKIGFRTIELIQEPVENSTGLSFYFKVNGVPFFAKGSNWIPADSFQERVTPQYIENLLQSAKEANMNMLRVWGGGIYETDEFYETADRLGLLIWQDLMFACALYPTYQDFLSSISTEVTQQVRRLQHHPSLLLWAGNNENEQAISGYWWPSVSQYLEQYKADYVKLYIDTIMLLVTNEDPTRTFLPSSPSNGPETVREGWISSNPQDNLYGDVHFYDYFGSEWNPDTYPRARFVSEYGFQSFPSFESLANVSNPQDWQYPLNDAMKHRQHHMFGNLQMDSMILKHFRLPDTSCGIQGFKDFLYLSQIVQAVAIKTETEKYRRSQSEVVNGEGKTMGALYWQLNDIWPAPSWASIEYGGRWKMLHYYAKHFFSPLLVSPYRKDDEAVVSVVSDLSAPLNNLILNISVFSWSSMEPLLTNVVTLKPPRCSKVVFQESITTLLERSGCPNENSCFLYFIVRSPEEPNLESRNVLFLSEFHSATGLKKPYIAADIIGPFKTEASDYTFNISLDTHAIAPFVWLDVWNIPGKFSDNGFLMVSETVVSFFSKDAIEIKDISNNLNITSLKDTCTN